MKELKKIDESFRKALVDSGGKVLSLVDTYFQRQINNIISGDTTNFLWPLLKKFAAPAFLILLLLSVGHFYFVKDTVKLLYLIAYYLGLLGVFLASYGFLFHLKGLVIERKGITIFSPSSLSGDPSRDTIKICEKFYDYISAQAEEKWHQVKVEIRKQVSVFIGFVLIFISFTIQLSLQFVK